MTALTLHVAGSPFAYRSSPGQVRVIVGPAGSDFVVRIMGDDAPSPLLEFNRSEAGWSVAALGRAGAKRNGDPLPTEGMIDLISGDQLSIAGVVTLFVDFDSQGGVRMPAVELPADECRAVRLLLEATRGDVIQLDGAT